MASCPHQVLKTTNTDPDRLREAQRFMIQCNPGHRDLLPLLYFRL